MYKIFFGDRTINIRQCLENKQIKSEHTYYHPDNEQLVAIMNEFANNEKLTEICICCHDRNEIMNSIKKLFHFVNAAGGLVVNSEGKYLLIKRLGLWDLPKGKAEKKENMQQTAIREVQEECGINELIITSELPSTFHTYSHKGKEVLKQTHWYSMTYTGNTPGNPQTEESITELRWMSKEEIKNEALDNTYTSLKDILMTVLQ
jgi:ADP-ribose pyrophosphatase YjhB (NUDIX family)